MGIATLAKVGATPKKEGQKFLIPVDKLPCRAQFVTGLASVKIDAVMGQPQYAMHLIPISNYDDGKSCKGCEIPPLKVVLDFSSDEPLKNVDEGSGAGKHNVLYIGGAINEETEDTEEAAAQQSPAMTVLTDYLGTLSPNGDWLPGLFEWNGEEGQKFLATGKALVTIEIGRANEIRGQAGKYYMPLHKIVDLDPLPTEAQQAEERANKRAMTASLFQKAKPAIEGTGANGETKPDNESTRRTDTEARA